MNTNEGSPVEQPATFEFTPENLERARAHIAKYPPGRQQSAVLPLLYLVQRQMGGWVPRVAMDYVAGLLDMAPIRVYEVATFYTMFNLRPVGRYLMQVCTTTPCWLRGSDDVVAACEKSWGSGSVGQAQTACSRWLRSNALALASMRRSCRSTTISTRISTAQRPKP